MLGACQQFARACPACYAPRQDAGGPQRSRVRARTRAPARICAASAALARACVALRVRVRLHRAMLSKYIRRARETSAPCVGRRPKGAADHGSSSGLVLQHMHVMQVRRRARVRTPL